MSAATGQDLTWYEGDTDYIDVVVKDSGGNVVNISGFTFEWSLGRLPSGPAMITKTTATGGGIEIINATGGVYRVSPDHAGAGLRAGVYRHQSRGTDGTSDKQHTMIGQIDLRPSMIG